MTKHPFQITFTLKQHTPIIHFQHEQQGATLRSTEVKPKFDQFIIDKNGGLENCRINHPKWFQSDKNNSLDYRISIHSTVDESLKFVIASRFKKDQIDVLDKTLPYIAPSPYFAQESDYKDLFHTKKLKKEKFINGEKKIIEIDIPDTLNSQSLKNIGKFGIVNDITLPFTAVIHSFQPELLAQLKRYFPEFLASENFGTRQSKGFGSFTVEAKPDGTNYHLTDFENDLKRKFKFVYKKTIPVRVNNQTEEPYDWLMQDIFKTIQYDYQLLKSGVGATKPNDINYRKSKLFLYGVSKNIRWEKRKIKQEINSKTISHLGVTYKLKSFLSPSVDNDKLNNNWKDKTEYNYRYLRAVLGLAEQLEFLTTGGRNSDKLIVQIKSQNGIERFQSPILFKVFDNNIYLVGNDVDENILQGKDFEFKYSIKAGKSSSPSTSLVTLKTPQSFDLGEFIKAGVSGMNYKPIQVI